VPIARTGKNALDFHLSFYMGYIASRRPEARFVVISNDKGYGPMLEHMIDLGFIATQVGFDNGKKATSMAPAKPASVESQVTPKKAAAKTTPVPKLATIAGATEGKKAPAKKAPAANKPAPAAKKAAPVKATAVAKKAVPAKTVPAKKTPPAKKIAKPAAPKPASGAETPKSREPISSTSKDMNKAVQHVQASLKKTTARPGRKAKLLASIKSLLGSPESSQMIEDVLGQLLASGKVLIDDKGAVRYDI
jgi:hypothetical protein